MTERNPDTACVGMECMSERSPKERMSTRKFAPSEFVQSFILNTFGVHKHTVDYSTFTAIFPTICFTDLSADNQY